jgi:hypothetical protein
MNLEPPDRFYDGRVGDLTVRRIRNLAGVVLTYGALVVGTAGVAEADGAFPDSQRVLLPSDRPLQIILAASFGLVFSDDDGGHWEYACEGQATTNGRLYSVGPAPDDRIFSVSDFGAAVTADRGCVWRLGGGLFDGGLVYDVFPDPVDAAHVLAVAAPPAPRGLQPAKVFESRDGGLTYGAVFYDGPATGGISGVEIARSDPRTIYVSTFEPTDQGSATHPWLRRSTDGGMTWETVDLEPMLGLSDVSIAAVDPNDARRLYLRVNGTNAQMRSVQQIAVSLDGGFTFSIPVSLTGGTLVAFLARRNGTVLVTGRLGATVVGYRSQDGAVTFPSWHVGLHPRGFAERGTTLFVAADDVADGFALGSSEDDGDSWSPRMHFGDVQAIRACVKQECLVDCGSQSAIGLFPRSACGPISSGSGGGGGGGNRSSGCSSAGWSTGMSLPAVLTVATFMLALALVLRRARRRNGR